MAYFRCVGGVGGGATLTLTYSSEFYGETITATDGTKTVTKVAPSTGTMDITLPESGTWVVSATIDGQTYSTTVTVNLGYTATLEAIPNGSTVTPTDDIQMWLKCAGIRDKDYTTLSQVLADTETFIALCADSNACDYMARSTTWALAEGLVPVLSSDLGTNGECVASYEDNSHPIWHAFDDNSSTKYVYSNPSASDNVWVGYHFSTPKVINRVNYVGNVDSPLLLPTKIRLQASNDGVNWIPLGEEITYSSADSAEHMIVVENITPYSYYSLKCSTRVYQNNYYVQFSKIQFFSDADITTNSTAMLIVGKYNYCANALIANATWCEALASSTYWEYIFDGCVPKMTSNTAPSGEVTGTTPRDTTTYALWKAFDRDTSTIYCGNVNTAANNTGGGFIQYHHTEPVCIKGIKLQSHTSNVYPYKSVKVEISDDGSTYDTIFDDSVDFVTGYVDISNNVKTGTYTKVTVTQLNDTGSSTYFPRIIDCQFYGRTDNANYIPLVPRMTSDTTPSGVVSSSSVYGNNTALFGAWRAFAYSTLTGVQDQRGWLPADGDTNPWVQYEFETHKIVNKWALTSYYGSGQKTFTLFGSNNSDFSNATELDTIQASSDSYATLHTSVFENNTAYKYYRVVITGTADTANKGIRCQFYRESDLPIIHSAVEDSIFYMNDGSPVALCGIPVGDTIDVDLEAYKGQTLTLVSTVAKDPTNLSNDFSMNVRITPNITEIYLMPLKELYWYGHESKLVEDTSPANGWSHSGWTFIAPNRRTNYIDLHASTSISDTKVTGIGTKWANNLATNVHCVYTGITLAHDDYGILIICSTKDIDGTRLSYESLTSNTMTKITKQIATGNYAGLDIGRSRQAYVHALWLE